MDTNIKAGLPLHPAEAAPHDVHMEAKLGLWDAVSIIVGIIIGVGIFETPPLVFKEIQEPSIIIVLWSVCGVVTLIGALCFAELASTYPRSGGEYVYLTRAFGPMTGFLFAWAQLTVIRSGSTAVVSYIFGFHAAAILGLDLAGSSVFILAGLSVVVLTLVNLLGVRFGTRTQNVLTVAKVLGLGAIVVVGFGWGRGEIDAPPVISHSASSIAGALILILWAYAGWHEAAYVVSEAKNRTRNIPLALILGSLIVTAIYILINIAYLVGLDAAQLQDKRCATYLVDHFWPGYGARAMNTLIVISSLGAINGSIFTTARIYWAFGADHRLFGTLSHWSKRWKTPARALIVQGVICLGFILGVWIAKGNRDSFEAAVNLTAAVFWMFFCLTGIALIVLRFKDPDIARPFRVPGYPVVPIIFCGFCAYMVIGTILYDAKGALIGLGILLLGLPLYFLPQKLKQKQSEQDLPPVAEKSLREGEAPAEPRAR
jgi:basic amino acid/polyamine antiporter, APA family